MLEIKLLMTIIRYVLGSHEAGFAQLDSVSLALLNLGLEVEKVKEPNELSCLSKKIEGLMKS